MIDRRMQSPVDILIARIETKSGLPIMQNVEDRRRKIVSSIPGVSEIDAKRIIVVVVILFDKVSFRSSQFFCELIRLACLTFRHRLIRLVQF